MPGSDLPRSSIILYQTEDIYDEGELPREATIRKFRIVRWEGSREVSGGALYGLYFGAFLCGVWFHQDGRRS
jgi:hypothetical protein